MTMKLGSRSPAPAGFTQVLALWMVGAAVLAFLGFTSLAALWRPGERAGRVILKVGTDTRTMVFDRTDLTVTSGSTVTVVFRNNLRVAPMPHNWVLVRPGTEAGVAEAGRLAGASAHYVRPGDSRVIASTPLTEPGKESSVTFVAPQPGSYPYVCTFPGHYLVMRGTLRVTAAPGLRAASTTPAKPTS